MNMNVQRLATALACWLCALSLVSCGSPESQIPLRIASSPWPGYEPIYLARDIGYLPKAQANIFELPSSDITLESFRNRSADMATLTLDETIELLASGAKLRILFVMDSSNGGDAVMVSPQIQKLSDLKEKRIAITNIPLGVYMLSRLLDAAKLERKDVQVLPSSENQHANMYRQGKADAFITFEPFKSELAGMGAHVIFDSSQIPNEILDLMVVHEDVFQSRRQEVCHVVKQWFRTLDYIKQSPDDAARRMSKRLGVNENEYHHMAGGITIPSQQENRKLLLGQQPIITPAAQKLLQVMLREGQLTKPVDISTALSAEADSCLTQ
ncbi:MAG: ABC transporter substrate-binding protein [Gallionella sp.]|nr:ABC transporter substrate-binding protein [Gallionella sp.]